MVTHPIRFIRSLGRSREIATVLIRHGFGDMVERTHLRRYLQWTKRLFFRGRGEPEAIQTRPERIRLALESLGPTFIKFGQVMSTRPDLIPADVIRELSRLREQVPPFPAAIARREIEGHLGARIEEVFSRFEDQPLAAASLSQVHRAELRDGTQVVVKVRRPSVVRDVERDLVLMFELAGLIERHIPEARVFDPVGLVQHFARTIRRELNFAREGRTIEEFARLFRHDATLFVPKVFPELCADGVLVMEFVEGYRVDDLVDLERHGIAPQNVAANGAHIFMRQTFEFGIFHGDPHPGNIRVMPDGSICLLDYGMIGVLDEEMRDKLVDLLLAVTQHNVPQTVELIQKVGRRIEVEPYESLDISLLRSDVRDFVETYYNVSLDKLNIGNLLTDFVGILSHHHIQCPGDVMLLIRALVTLEGVGRSLDPDFNLAAPLAPFVEQIVRDRYDPRRVAGRIFDESRQFLRLAHDVPLFIGRSLEKLSNDDIRFQFEHRGLDRFITEVDRSSNRVVIGLVMSSLIVASALVIRATTEALWWFTVPMFLLWSLLGVWLIYGVFRSGRL